jgi:hypothetical protein
MRLAVDQAMNTIPTFIEAIVPDKSKRNEIDGPCQRNAMLLDIGGVLGEVELDVHGFRIYRTRPRMQCFRIYIYRVREVPVPSADLPALATSHPAANSRGRP